MATLQTIHGELRWLLLLLALAVSARYLWGWLRGAEFARMDRGLMSAFSGLLDLNVTVGIILLLWRGVSEAIWPAYRLEHAVTMIVATAVVHASRRWRSPNSDARKFRNGFLVVLGAMLLVLVGVVRLRGGWLY